MKSEIKKILAIIFPLGALCLALWLFLSNPHMTQAELLLSFWREWFLIVVLGLLGVFMTFEK